MRDIPLSRHEDPVWPEVQSYHNIENQRHTRRSMTSKQLCHDRTVAAGETAADISTTARVAGRVSLAHN
jgi:hypothetical protein